jgi:hypothetical protein
MEKVMKGMSRAGVWVVAVILLFASPVCAEMHVFSLQDGRVLEAEIVDYNGKLGKVTLKRLDGKRVPVKVNIFVEVDQQYIKEWAASNAFLSDSILQVKCNDQVLKKWKEEEKRDIRYTGGEVEEGFVHNVIKYEDIVYAFTFKNTASTSIRGLHLEYCIYYEQSYMVWEEKPEMEQKTFSSSLELSELKEKLEVTVNTKPVMIYEDDINPVPIRDGDQRRPGKGKIIGIRARLSMKAGDKNIVREIVSPNSLSEEKYPWSTKTSSNKRPAYRKGG